MEREQFNKIFDKTILPFIEELEDNNSLIERNNLEDCKQKIYMAYMALNKRYKHQIFECDADSVLLDRHKVAACICGAFLEVPIFNKTKLIRYIKDEKQRIEVYFYYVNELVALFAATKILSFYMILDNQGDDEIVRAILNGFPKALPITKNKRGFWNSVVFNLSQINDNQQIGIKHYDMYSYAMFFFFLENYFNEKVAA